MTPRRAYLDYWEGDLPDPGEYLETRAGTVYCVLAITPSRPGSKRIARLDLLRLDDDDALDAGRRRHGFQWNSRRRRSTR